MTGENESTNPRRGLIRTSSSAFGLDIEVQGAEKRLRLSTNGNNQLDIDDDSFGASNIIMIPTNIQMSPDSLQIGSLVPASAPLVGIVASDVTMGVVNISEVSNILGNGTSTGVSLYEGAKVTVQAHSHGLNLITQSGGILNINSTAGVIIFGTTTLNMTGTSSFNLIATNTTGYIGTGSTLTLAPTTDLIMSGSTFSLTSTGTTGHIGTTTSLSIASTLIMTITTGVSSHVPTGAAELHIGSSENLTLAAVTSASLTCSTELELVTGNGGHIDITTGRSVLPTFLPGAIYLGAWTNIFLASVGFMEFVADGTVLIKSVAGGVSIQGGTTISSSLTSSGTSALQGATTVGVYNTAEVKLTTNGSILVQSANPAGITLADFFQPLLAAGQATFLKIGSNELAEGNAWIRYSKPASIGIMEFGIWGGSKSMAISGASLNIYTTTTVGTVGSNKNMTVNGDLTVTGTISGGTTDASTLQGATWESPLTIGSTTANTGTFTNLVSGSLQVDGAKVVSTQGTHIQWNKPAGSFGFTSILNNRGGAPEGGIQFGDVSGTDVTTEWCFMKDSGFFTQVPAFIGTVGSNKVHSLRSCTRYLHSLRSFINKDMTVNGNLTVTGTISGGTTDAATLQGATWEEPLTIGSTTPNTGNFTTSTSETLIVRQAAAPGQVIAFIQQPNLTNNQATFLTIGKNTDAVENSAFISYEYTGTIGRINMGIWGHSKGLQLDQYSFSTGANYSGVFYNNLRGQIHQTISGSTASIVASEVFYSTLADGNTMTKRFGTSGIPYKQLETVFHNSVPDSDTFISYNLFGQSITYQVSATKLTVGDPVGGDKILKVYGTTEVTGQINVQSVIAIAHQPITAQGAHMMWNKDGGSGRTYFINQSGGGGGSFLFAESTTGDALTEILDMNTTNSTLKTTLSVTGGNLTVTGGNIDNTGFDVITNQVTAVSRTFTGNS